MHVALARLAIAAVFTGVALSAQTTVCDLFRDFKAADGQRLILTGDLLLSNELAAIGAADCDYRFISEHTMWPAALQLLPSSSARPEQIKRLQDAAVEADRLRKTGRTVSASASFSGRVQARRAGDLPGEFVFDSFENLKVEALADASELPVIPICELFQNLSAWRGKRIAVRGQVAGTMEGTWLNGRCKGGFITNGYRWPVSLSYAGPAYYSASTESLAKTREPSSPPKGEETFRGRNSVVRSVTWVGQLRMRDNYTAVCRGGDDYLTNGFGHMGAAAAELMVEEIRDEELTKPPAEAEVEEEQKCQPPNIEALCSKASSLSEAAGLGCPSRVAELLSKHRIDSKYGSESKALSAAIRIGDLAVARMLLDAGAPVNPVGPSQPLAAAAVRGRIEIMKLLLKAGAKVDAVDHRKATLLAGYGFINPFVVKTLLDAGANPNAGDIDHRTALMQAAHYGCEDATVILLERGAAVNQKDNKGRTALMYAAAGKYVDAIPHLIEKGADVNARDSEGKTALDIARQSKNEVAVELLSSAVGNSH